MTPGVYKCYDPSFEISIRVVEVREGEIDYYYLPMEPWKSMHTSPIDDYIEQWFQLETDYQDFFNSL